MSKHWIVICTMLSVSALAILSLYSIFGTGAIILFPTYTNTNAFGQRFAQGGRYEGSHPSLSPDGKYVVFGSPQYITFGDIYRIDIDGRNRSPIHATKAYDGDPVFADTGELVAFISEIDGISHVYTMKPDGSEVKRITNSDFPDDSPIFSADGSMIAFSRHLSENPDWFLTKELFVIGADGDGERRLTTNGVMDSPIKFTRDGKSLYYASGDSSFDLCKLDINTGQTHLVLSLGPNGLGCAVSPDDSAIAFLQNVEKPGRYELFISGLDGTNKRQLTNLGKYIGGVQFSHDGKVLVFVAEPHGSGGRGAGDICLVDCDKATLVIVGQN